MRALVLLLVNIFCLAKFVKSYGVTEHRVDYIKAVDGHEYDYHYHDGSAPRFEKSKLHYLQQQEQRQQQHQRNHNLNQQQQLFLITKRPYKQPFKQPYFNKYFSTPIRDHNYVNNEFQAAAAASPSYTSSISSSHYKQQNSIPIFESHEKVRNSFLDDDDDEEKTNVSHFDHEEERPAKRRPVSKPNTLTRPNSIIGANLLGLQSHNNDFRNNRYHSYDDSSESGEILPKPSAAPTLPSHPYNFLTNSSAPVNFPGFHFISGGYTYFSSHPLPKKKQQPILIDTQFVETPLVHTTTTRRPYVAPTLTPPPPPQYFQQRPTTKAPLQRRPYIAPSLTTTKRPYVAPSVLRSTTKTTDASLLAFAQNPIAVNGASRFRYTNNKATTTKATASSSAKKSEKHSELYEPEFDIDIRIDLSSDSGH
ncbi:uncharacterized protein LOC134224836 [Armigeres subalbatus]|uniref:uncharacterized protein LOC134224836 n=1 Tax=Armigeres subalbatus TaxID=124917 RepID=UPI002ED51E43